MVVNQDLEILKGWPPIILVVAKMIMIMICTNSPREMC